MTCLVGSRTGWRRWAGPLLVADGCDAVVDGAASLVASLLTDCPGVTVLVTGRSALGVGGEHVVRLDPLPPDRRRPRLGAPAHQPGPPVGWPARPDRRAGAVRRRALSPLRRAAARAGAGGGAARPSCRRAMWWTSSTRSRRGDDELRQVAEAGCARGPTRRPRCSGGWRCSTAPRASRSSATSWPTQIPRLRVVRILRELTARGLVTVHRSGPRRLYPQDDDLRRSQASASTRPGEAPQTERRRRHVRALLPDDPSRRPRRTPTRSRPSSTGSVPSSPPARRCEGPADDPDGCLEIAFRLHRYWAATNVGEGRFWLSRLLAGPDTPWSPYARYALGYLSYWAGDTPERPRAREGRGHPRRGRRRADGPGPDLSRGAPRRPGQRRGGDGVRAPGHDRRGAVRRRPAGGRGDGPGQRGGRARRSRGR